jgi:hypothetical protein
MQFETERFPQYSSWQKHKRPSHYGRICCMPPEEH